MNPLRALATRWIESRWLDWVGAAIAVVVCDALAVRAGIDPFTITGSAAVTGAPLYFFQTLATVSGVFLTIGTLAASLLFAVTPTERLRVVLERKGASVAAVVSSSLLCLLGTTVGFALLYLFDPTTQLRYIRGITVGLIVLAVARAVRLWWLIGRTIGLMARVEAPGRVPDIVPTIGDADFPRRRVGR